MKFVDEARAARPGRQRRPRQRQLSAREVRSLRRSGRRRRRSRRGRVSARRRGHQHPGRFSHRAHLPGARNGEGGSGNGCTGRSGEDLYITVPVGTTVRDAETGEELGDLTAAGQVLKVAQGGKGGYGNARFKSSTNRAPRQFGPGLPGERRTLALELKVIADVGPARAAQCRQIHADPRPLGRASQGRRLSLHDAVSEPRRGGLRRAAQLRHGRHSRASSKARPRGRAWASASCVICSARVCCCTSWICCRLDPAADPVRDARAIVAELRKFSRAAGRQAALAGAQQARPAARRARPSSARPTSRGGCATAGRDFLISAATGRGTRELAQAVMQFLEER